MNWSLFQFSFVQNAIVVVLFISIAASLVGVPLVMKRYSLIGMGLSNVAFVGMAISALIINLANDLFIVMPLTVLASMLLLGRGSKTRVKGDASIAMLSVGALAVGFFIASNFSRRGDITARVNDALFGANEIMLLSTGDIWVSLVITILVVAAFIFLHNRLFAVTFDQNFMQATGTKPEIYNYILAAIIGVVIAISMQMVGALLTSAFIIFPALSAMRVFKNYKFVIIASAAIAAISALFGIFTAILFDTPPSVTIILFNIAVYGLFCIAGRVIIKIKSS